MPDFNRACGKSNPGIIAAKIPTLHLLDRSRETLIQSTDARERTNANGKKPGERLALRQIVWLKSFFMFQSTGSS
jgi:hypothetical protein